VFDLIFLICSWLSWTKPSRFYKEKYFIFIKAQLFVPVIEIPLQQVFLYFCAKFTYPKNFIPSQILMSFNISLNFILTYSRRGHEVRKVLKNWIYFMKPYRSTPLLCTHIFGTANLEYSRFRGHLWRLFLLGVLRNKYSFDNYSIFSFSEWMFFYIPWYLDKPRQRRLIRITKMLPGLNAH